MSTIIKIQHGAMSAEISTLGAELQSLRHNGREYLWQGDPAFWAGRAPVLFPITGRVWGNHYRHNGKEYQLDIHGFARHMEFTPVEQKEDRVVLGLKSTDDTLACYPFPFMLFITYQLSDRDLAITWFVRNEGSEEMHFQIGAHPAFYLPDFDPADSVRGYFSFLSRDKEVPTYLIPLEKGCVNPSEPHTLPLDAEGMLPITEHTFDIDTYVIDSRHLSACTLLSAERVPFITVDFHMPILSLWAPTNQHPDCPFVCIEPWCGSCDTIGYEGEFGQRRVMNHLEPGAHFTNTYNIHIH